MPLTPLDHDDLIEQIINKWEATALGLNTQGTRTIGRIVRLHEIFSKKLNDNLSNYQLNIGEFNVLAALRREKAHFQLTPGQLQNVILVSSGGLSNRINRLEERGLIFRRADPDDRRGVIVQLTQAGLKLIDAVTPTHLALECQFAQALTEEEQALLANLLKKMLLAQND